MPPSSGFRRDGWAVKWIIGVCVAMYFVQSATSEHVVRGQLSGGATELFLLNMAGLKDLQIWRVFTYGLCHGDLRHLMFNMVGVWFLGRMVESVYGSKETVAFFAAAVGLSGLVHVGVMAFFNVSVGVVGASGGVLGLVTLAAMNFPRMPMQFFFIPISIELRWIASGYVAIDVFQLIAGGGHVAHLAHLAGAGVGVLYFSSGIRLLSGSNQYGKTSGFSLGSVLSRLKPKRKPNRKHAPEVKLYEPPREKLKRDVDRLLDKINREGKDSLTREEHDILMKASESYRNRV